MTFMIRFAAGDTPPARWSKSSRTPVSARPARIAVERRQRRSSATCSVPAFRQKGAQAWRRDAIGQDNAQLAVVAGGNRFGPFAHLL
jgi:hypothetical protein